MKLTLLPLALTAALAVSAAPVYEIDNCRRERIDQLAVFGDSYSDIHNVYELSKHTWPLPKTYFKGRFSNGPIWSEYVAKAKRYKLLDYAYGGATSDASVVQGYSGSDSTLAVPGFIQQIQTYNPATKSRATMARTLFAVNFQGNDFIFSPDIDTQVVLANIERGIRELIAAGAKNFLIVENFNYGLVPYFSADPAVAAKYAAIAAKEHAEYKGLIRKLRDEFSGAKACHGGSGIDFDVLDLYEFFKGLSSPRELRRLGITETVKGCVSNDYKTVCPNPEEYFYYDGFHATTKIHYEIAKAVVRLI
ncbi:hypothetical protein BGZ93_005963 [Podila epicladia]|nr:hypothetical protein BGZ92_001439 [Podila epicladia]KAG0095362.1 hypothetical protein BGZ93_005963 [Podila epicladia]